jgi:hypothetical protein
MKIELKISGLILQELLGVPRCAANSRPEMEIRRNNVECRKALEMNYIHRH